MPDRDPLDPRGLIREAFVMEGVVAADCRSIYFDWALGLEDGADARAATAALLERYEPDHPEHPMVSVLREGLQPAAAPRRSGRRRERRGPADDPSAVSDG